MRNIKAYRFCLESRANKLKHEAAATQKEGSKEKLQFADKKELPFIREKACERASSFPSSSQKLCTPSSERIYNSTVRALS